MQRRGEFREAHLAAAWRSHDEGGLLMGGAFAEPADGALIIFRGASSRVAEDFAANDPYVLNGLVTSWRVREWTTVAGDQAATPLRPQPART